MCPEMKELVFIIRTRFYAMEKMVELKDFGGQFGVGELELRNSCKAGQLRGFNVSAKLVIMGIPTAWTRLEGKLVEVVDLSV